MRSEKKSHRGSFLFAKIIIMSVKQLLLLSPYMIKNPKFFKNILNLPVKSVHPIIAFAGEKNYYFMAMKSYKDKYKKQIKNYKKIILNGHGEGYQMSKRSVLDSDVIYKIDKRILEKNVFSEKKMKVKTISNLEVEEIINDLCETLSKTPPKIVLAKINLNHSKQTQTVIIYGEKTVVNQYKNAARLDFNKHLSEISDFNSRYLMNRISNNFFHYHKMTKEEIIHELEDFKSLFLIMQNHLKVWNKTLMFQE
ncbi:Mbov_0400 family ICE element protein [Mycoplasmopsis agassizii]|uniref:Mbov_0400 family ICE element protein n=1 Tax=Mycoplasmopsis agassizii TaxID=33922 RepID=UPI003526E3EB